MDLHTALVQGVPLQFRQGFIARIAAIYPNNYVFWMDAKGKISSYPTELFGEDVTSYAPIMGCLQLPTRRQAQPVSMSTLGKGGKTPIWKMGTQSPPWENREIPFSCQTLSCIQKAIDESLGYHLFPHDNSRSTTQRNQMVTKWIRDKGKMFLVVSRRLFPEEYVVAYICVWENGLRLPLYVESLTAALSTHKYEPSIPWEVMQPYVSVYKA